MAIDIETLVAPLGEDAPSGPDLSYDNERIEIESAFERSVGGEDGDAAETDWRGTIGLITAQAQKTRDLWLPVYLMRAAAQTGNVELVADGAELLARLLEERWPDVHPQLDEYGFIGRKTPCESLTRIGEFLAPLSRVALLEHPRLGRYSGADFDRFQQEGSNAENFGMFRAALDATDAEVLQQAVARVDAIRGAIRRADAVLTANAEGDTGTNFAPTYEQLDKIRRAVASFLPGGAGGAEDAPAQAGESAPAGGAAPGGNAGGGPGFSGGINSRADVERALDAIAAYYARCEPASPVPLALRRAREWISLDFLAVLEDIAPGSLDEAKRVLTSGRSNAGGGASNWATPGETDTADSSGSDDGW